MSYKPYRQILTFFDLSKKSPTAAGNISTLRYELLNHLNTFYYSHYFHAPVRVFLRTGAFCMLKNFFEKISENIWHFFKAPYCPAKRGKHHQLSARKEVRMWNLTAGNFISNALFRSIVIRYCTMKRATLTESFALIRQRR